VIARDLIYDAALNLNAVQLGEPLTDAEAQAMLRAWQRLIKSRGLSRANIHTVRSDTYPIYSGQDTYTLGYDPRLPAITVSSATNASVVVLTLATPHGITVGRTNSVVLAGAEGTWQPVNGGFIATALSSTTISLPIDSTSFDVGITGAVTLIVGGNWNYVRPASWEAFKTASLLWPGRSRTDVYKLAAEEYDSRSLTDLTSPPRSFYPDGDAPVTTVKLYPIPDADYTIEISTSQGLEYPFTIDDELEFADGYERYWVYQLAIESSSIFDITPSPALMANAEDAKHAVKSVNQRSPNLKGDPALVRNSMNGRLYFYSGGRR
jgi:hypothetical protein